MNDNEDNHADDDPEGQSEVYQRVYDDPDRPRTTVRLPSLWLMVARPGLTVQWISAAVEGWIWSRLWLRMLPGLPFLAAAVWLVMLLIETPGDLIDQVNRLRALTQQPESEQQPVLHELRLRALSGLLPDDHTPLLALARFHEAQGRFDEAVQLMQTLAEWGELGIPEARMWLVEDTLSANPHQHCSDEELERHLRLVLRVLPTNVEAHAFLSALLLKRGELLLAERSLQTAADLAPRYYVPLIRLQRSLGRQEVGVETIRQAIVKVAAALARRPDDVETRISLARLHVLTNDFAAAESVLEAGRQLSDSAMLQRATGEVHTAHAQFLLRAGTLNRDEAAGLIIRALKLDALNITAVETADRLARLEAWFPPDLISGVAEQWRAAFSRLPDRFDVRLALCRILELNNEPEASLELLKPLLDRQPELNSKAVELLMKAGKEDAARTAAEKSLQALRSQSTVATARRTAAECLLVLRDFAAVRQLLQPEGGGLPADREEQLLFGIACLQEFDALSGRPRKAGPAADYWIPDFSRLSSEQPQQLIELLKQAGAIESVRMDAADRLARVSLLDHPAAETAAQLILQLRARESHSAEILNQLGAHAILHERYAKAREWLEQGSLLAGGKNPAILNNLSLAILRGKLDNPQRALLLINEALELLPNNPELLSTRGEIHVALKLWNNAREDLELSLATRGGRPKVHRLLEATFRGLLDEAQAENHRRAAEELERADKAANGS